MAIVQCLEMDTDRLESGNADAFAQSTARSSADYWCAVMDEDSSTENVKGPAVFVRVRRCRPVACFCGSWAQNAKQLPDWHPKISPSS